MPFSALCCNGKYKPTSIRSPPPPNPIGTPHDQNKGTSTTCSVQASGFTHLPPFLKQTWNREPPQHALFKHQVSLAPLPVPNVQVCYCHQWGGQSPQVSLMSSYLRRSSPLPGVSHPRVFLSWLTSGAALPQHPAPSERLTFSCHTLPTTCPTNTGAEVNQWLV